MWFTLRTPRPLTLCWRSFPPAPPSTRRRVDVDDLPPHATPEREMPRTSGVTVDMRLNVDGQVRVVPALPADVAAE